MEGLARQGRRRLLGNQLPVAICSVPNSPCTWPGVQSADVKNQSGGAGREVGKHLVGRWTDLVGAMLAVCVEFVTKSGLGLRSPDLRMGLFSQQPAACAAFSGRLLMLSAPPTPPEILFAV